MHLAGWTTVPGMKVVQENSEKRQSEEDAPIVGMWPSPGLCFCNGLVFLKCCKIPEARRTSVMINNITREVILGRSRVPMRTGEHGLRKYEPFQQDVVRL